MARARCQRRDPRPGRRRRDAGRRHRSPRVRQRPHGSAVGSRRGGLGHGARARTAGRADADAGSRPRVRRRAGRPDRGADRRGTAPGAHRPRPVAGRLPGRLLHHRAGHGSDHRRAAGVARVETVRIGTRGSTLARTQTGQVADALRALGDFEIEFIHIRTDGDRLTGSLATLGRTGVFVTALRDALLEGRCDLAVHSLKDLPTGDAPGLTIAAIPPRADARDALCSRDGRPLVGLPSGARVGTGSPRRVAQLLAVRPDLEVVDLRGNVDTRLRRVTEGDLDAVVLAAAGLQRIGRLDATTVPLEPTLMVPAPGQGALAVECRADLDPGSALALALRALDDLPTRLAVTAERAVLATLEAGCSARKASARAEPGSRSARHSTASAPWPGAGTINVGSSGTVVASRRPIRCRPAAASTTASRSPSVTRRSRVSTLPRRSTTSRSGRTASSWATRRGEPVPTRAPLGSPTRGRPSRVHSASRASARGTHCCLLYTSDAADE